MFEWPPASKRIGGADRGYWVLLATLHRVNDVFTMAILDPRAKPVRCRRYNSSEEAVADAHNHSAMRVGGGIAVNVCTGETRMVLPKL